jgi:hypothetical protein
MPRAYWPRLGLILVLAPGRQCGRQRDQAALGRWSTSESGARFSGVLREVPRAGAVGGPPTLTAPQPAAKPHIARPETRRLARVLAGGTGLAVDAVRVDLEQDGDAMPGAAAAVEDAVAKAPGQSSARR